jgi:hypothetical protein
VDEQGEFESEHLWQHVSAAIARDDQVNSMSDLLSVIVRLEWKTRHQFGV